MFYSIAVFVYYICLLFHILLCFYALIKISIYIYFFSTCHSTFSSSGEPNLPVYGVYSLPLKVEYFSVWFTTFDHVCPISRSCFSPEASMPCHGVLSEDIRHTVSLRPICIWILHSGLHRHGRDKSKFILFFLIPYAFSHFSHFFSVS